MGKLTFQISQKLGIAALLFDIVENGQQPVAGRAYGGDQRGQQEGEKTKERLHCRRMEDAQKNVAALLCLSLDLRAKTEKTQLESQRWEEIDIRDTVISSCHACKQ